MALPNITKHIIVDDQLEDRCSDGAYDEGRYPELLDVAFSGSRNAFRTAKAFERFVRISCGIVAVTSLYALFITSPEPATDAILPSGAKVIEELTDDPLRDFRTYAMKGAIGGLAGLLLFPRLVYNDKPK